MAVRGRVNAVEFIDFMERLIHGVERKVFLLVDGHPVHKARKVKRFVESHNERLQLFYLPPYSPELNPDERVWNDLKNNAVEKQVITTPKELHRAVISHLRSIQKSPARVRSCFNNETTMCAA